MKRRTFVKTVLGGLGAWFVGDKVLGKNRHSFAINKSLKGKHVWGRIIDVGYSTGHYRYVLIDPQTLDYFRRVYKDRLKQGFGPFNTKGSLTVWVEPHYIEIDSKHILS